MKPKSVPLLIVLAGIALGISAVSFLAKAGGTYTTQDARWPLIVSGIVCVALGTGLLITGAVLAMRKRD